MKNEMVSTVHMDPTVHTKQAMSFIFIGTLQSGSYVVQETDYIAFEIILHCGTLVCVVSWFVSY